MKAPPLLLRLGVSLGILLGLAWILDVDALVARLAGLRPGWALVALAISVPQVALSAWRWRFTAGRLGIHLPFRQALREYYLAGFLNQVLPGGVAGDVSRAWRHARTRSGEPVGGGVAARAVLFERASGQLVMSAVALLSFLSLPLAHGGGTKLAWVASWSVAGLIALIALFGFRRRRRALASPPVAGLRQELYAALLGRGALPTQVATSALVITTYLAMYLAAARAVGVDTPFPVLLPLVAPVLMSMLIPATIAGWGVREGTAAVLCSAVGLTAVDGVAISTAYGVLVLLSTLPGALFLLMTTRGRKAGPLPDGSADSADAAPGPGSRSAVA